MPVWIKFTLTERGYKDKHGRPLANISGKRNRPGVDEFDGGGKDGYPTIDKSKRMESYEKGTDLLIRVDLSPAEANKTGGTVLTDAEAAKMKKDVFKIIESESGVTK